MVTSGGLSRFESGNSGDVREGKRRSGIKRAAELKGRVSRGGGATGRDRKRAGLKGRRLQGRRLQGRGNRRARRGCSKSTGDAWQTKWSRSDMMVVRRVGL